MNGTNLTNNGRITGVTNNSLSINIFSVTDAGAYTVVVSNAYGATIGGTLLMVTPNVSWSNPASITYGTFLSTNQLDATADAPGTFVYMPGRGTVLDAGNRNLTAVFTPNDTNTFTSVTTMVSLVVQPEPLTVNVDSANRALGQTNPVFAGTLVGVTNVDVISATYATTATTNSPAGEYPIVATLIDPGNRLTNYTVTTNNGILDVYSVVNRISWPTPTPIVYGTALGTNQLNATATVHGSFTYSPTNGAVLNAGSNTLTAVFTPAQPALFNSATNTVILVVQPAPLSVTANSTSRVMDHVNPPFTGVILGLTNGDNITATYASTATSNSPAGPYPIVPILVDPNDRLTNYAVAITNGTLTVLPSGAIITWTNPASIPYGTPLGTNQLNASANTGGSFAYSPPLSAVLPSGTNLLSVVFTPSDTNTYSVVTGTLSLVVSRVPLSATATDASRPYGATNPAFTGLIIGLVNSDNITASYASPATTNSPQGTYPIVPTLVDPNNRQTNYIVSLTNGTLTVTHGISIVTWNPSPIIYGTALSSNQLNATANTLGTFVYSVTNGTVLNVATNQVSVAFTPNDTTNFLPVTNTVNLVVTPAPLIVTGSNAARAYGDTNPVFTGTIVGVTNGDNITATFSCSAVTNSTPGPYAIVPALIDPNNRLTNYSTNLVNGSLTIAPIPTQVTWITPSQITYGTALDTNQLNATATVPGTFAYSPPPGYIPNSGPNTLSVTFTPNDSITYAGASANVRLQVNQASLSFAAGNASRQVGATNPIFTGSTNGLVNGDNITAAFTCTATKFSLAGTYPIVPVVADPNNRLTNYLVSLTNGELTVGIQLRVVSSNDPAIAVPLYLVGQGSALFLTGRTTNGDSAIFSLPTAGGSAATLYSAHNPLQITVQGTNLFWIDPNSGAQSHCQIFEVPTAANRPATNYFTSPGLPGTLQTGSGLASDGLQLYAADENGGGVLRVNANNSVTSIGGATRYSGGANTAHLNTIAASQGVIYLADAGQVGVSSPQVVSIATNGSAFTTLASGSPIISPSGIAVGTNGMVYVADPSAGNTIWQIPLSGGAPTAFLSGAPFVGIQGLAFIDGTLYITDPGAGTVYAAMLTTPIPVTNVPPTITWSPAPITYGTPLSGSQLNATASFGGSAVAGSFIYTPSAGAVLNAGTNTLSVVFNPTNTLDYTSATDTVNLVVLPAQLTVTANSTNRPVGQPNPAFTGSISGVVNGDSFGEAFSTTATNTSPTGAYPIMPSVVDTNNQLTNYSVTLVDGTLTIGTVVIWTNPAPIIYGTALGSAQLNATANVPGNFVYNPPVGTELNTGTNLLSVVFNPADSVDYFSVTNSVSLVVVPATLSVSAANVTRAYGDTNPIFTTTILGLQNGDLITATATCNAVSNSLVGSYTIVPSLSDPSNRLANYTVQLVNGTLTISPLPPATYSQAYTFTTMAGYPGFGSANGANAQFNNPSGVAVDAAGNIYVADTDNDTIRKVTPDGVVSTVAGIAGNAGSTNGPGNVAQFNFPYGLAVDAATNIYVADTYNHTIRLITPAGQVSTIAGVPAFAGNADGPGTSAHFNNPSGVAVDSGGNNVYVADSTNNTIRRLTRSGNNWTVTTIAGTPGVPGTNDGAGALAQFAGPAGIALDAATNLYVADTRNAVIRKLALSGTNWIVSTIAGLAGVTNASDGFGTNAQFNSPFGLTADGNGNLYVGDMNNSTIRKLKLTNGLWKVSTIAGSPGIAGDIDATAGAARFSNPSGVAVDSAGSVYVADAKNALIRKITTANAISTFAGSVGGPGSADGPGNNARFYLPSGTAISSAGTIFVADTQNNTIRRISSAGEVSTYAGTAGTFGSADGAGSVAQFANPAGVAVDVSGNVYVADTFNFTIRKITADQVVSTIAGSPGNIGSADGVTTNAQFAYPSGLATDTNGNIYVADTGNNTIRRITLAGVVTTIAGQANVVAGTNDGVGTNAQFNFPFGLAVDVSGRIFVADAGNDTIRMITPVGPNWIVTNIAGRIGSSGYTDGSNGVAQFNFPQGIAVDAGGDLFVADTFNFTIRKIEPNGNDWAVSTIGGLPGAQPGSADGTGSAARFYSPQGICVDHLGTLFIGDTQNNIIRRGDFGQYVPAKLVPFQQPNTSGQITVLLTGAPSAQWRFPWELTWRNSGTSATNLAAGMYPVEFSTVAGYFALPLQNPVNLSDGATITITNQYYPTVGVVDTNNGGSLTVDIQPSPPPGAGWRFLGDTGAFNSPNTSTNLAAGTYLVEFAPVSGFSTPPTLSVQIADGVPTVIQITYQLAQATPSAINLPVPVPPLEIDDINDFPFGFNGQLETDVGYGSGVAVQNQVVLTAAHLVFDDQTLSYVSEAWWFNQREKGIFEPAPLQARGWYVLSGYASQRTNDLKGGLSPDQSSPQSRNMDVAALYFQSPVYVTSPIGEGGYGGYLPSDTVPNEWLSSSANKLLVGYPVDGSQLGATNIVPGLMYETGPQRTPLTLASDPVNDQQVYVAPWLLSYPGNSGGPFYVQFNGYYYPAGVYLGTLYNGIVPYASAIRAIDSNVVNMIALAAALGDNGTNNSGGGVVTISAAQGITIKNPGGVGVTIHPKAAFLAGAAWKLSGFDDTYYSVVNPSSLVVTSIIPTQLQFKPVPGWNLPPNQSVIALPGSVTNVNSSYSVAVNWPTPAAIQSGTPLGPNQLDVTTITSGTYVYSLTNGTTVSNGTVLSAGTYSITVTFTPGDSANYGGPSTTNVTLVVSSGGGGSAPVIQSAKISSGFILLTWSAATNRQYQIQSKADLMTTNWTTLGSPITATNASMNASLSLGTNTKQFYRILLLP